MATLQFPALFITADSASNRLQRTYLNLIRGEYGLLLVAAIFTLFNCENTVFLIAYACAFLAPLIVLAWRSHARPEQGWYKARALAESIKTLSWRYAMRAEPFDDERQADANLDFRDSLAALLRANRQIGEHLAGLDATGPQITDTMSMTRNSSLRERKSLYLSDRIADQKDWYSRKSIANRNSARNWQFVGGACYISSVVMVFLKVRFTGTAFPFEPLILIASSVLGWMQIKKFNELSSAYALTAHEIGLAEPLINDAKNETQFSKAINEVELVFSREHTQWIARQTAGE